MRPSQVFVNMGSLVVVMVRYLIVKNSSLIDFTKSFTVKYQWDVFFWFSNAQKAVVPCLHVHHLVVGL